jgi:RNA polymerase sigma-70 factor (ECF subfamily)
VPIFAPIRALLGPPFAALPYHFPKLKLAVPNCGTRCFNHFERVTFHMQMEDRPDILARVRTGDTGAFEDLVRTYQNYAYQLAVRMLFSETEAQDVVQEAFVRVWRSINRYDPSVRFTTWLYRIVTNLCLDQIRAEKRRNVFRKQREAQSEAGSDPPAAVDIEKAVSTADLMRIVRTLAGDLPETQRLVFTLRDLQDLSINEVSRITGLSEASIKTNLHYARRTLRERMEVEYGVRGKP